MWTRFDDMFSGGNRKLSANVIWIQAPMREACNWFEEIFDRDPSNVTCNCCGPDFSIRECDDTKFKEMPAVKHDSIWIITSENLADFVNGNNLYLG